MPGADDTYPYPPREPGTLPSDEETEREFEAAARRILAREKEKDMSSINVKVSIPVTRKWTDYGPKHEECKTDKDWTIEVSGPVVKLSGDGQEVYFNLPDLRAAVDFLEHGAAKTKPGPVYR